MEVNRIKMTFSEMIERCNDHSIIEWKNKEIILTGKLSHQPKVSWFDGSVLAILKEKDENGDWSKSSAYCHFNKMDEVNEIEIGTTISIIGTLNFADDNSFFSGIYTRLINCKLYNEEMGS
jgi:hypothetical protein